MWWVGLHQHDNLCAPGNSICDELFLHCNAIVCSRDSNPLVEEAFDPEPELILRRSADLLVEPTRRSNAVTQTAWESAPSPDRQSFDEEFTRLQDADRAYWDTFLNRPLGFSEAKPTRSAQPRSPSPPHMSPAELHWKLTDALKAHEDVLTMERDLERIHADFVHSTTQQEIGILASDVELAHVVNQQVRPFAFSWHMFLCSHACTDT